MNSCRLHDYFWPICCALLINGMLFMGIAVLCRESPSSKEMTISSPIHLAAGAFAVPSQPAHAELPQPAVPELPSEPEKIPEIPRLSDAAVHSQVEPVSEIELPQLQHEIAPDLMPVKIPKPSEGVKSKAKPKRLSARPAQVPAAESVLPEVIASPAGTAVTSGTPGKSSGAAAGQALAGADLNSREFGLGEVDQAPQVIKQHKPSYPLLARRRNLTGNVTVKFLVDRRGKVCKPKIIEAHPEGVFEQSVLESVTKWRFKPGVYQGSEVSTWVVLPIQFRLAGG
ncbi:energy transducer TonB [Desulfoferrobacter suflitae]|uniref:energy transducer TonB n=1 Tax=Desulfoferrobacter suflitae TaxID=2865782 RepID=UPI0021649B0A|nr:energy transducer TonB [Desulfoferrobacter suflitae]MCK8601159.1 energy transducer TonB [Desulfoferrobacter suflitae]